MPTCQLCKRDFRSLRFNTEHIGICVRCVNTLNNSPEPARFAEARLGELLARGMRRNAMNDLQSDIESVRVRAKRTLDSFDAAYQRALPGWINRLLENADNNTRDFKMMRAYRRGMLRMDGGEPWTYPSDWTEKARRIRYRDQCCQLCGVSDVPLDVHHIIYLSNFGTNQQSNLVGLCRSCHEEIHDRSFDLGETHESRRAIPGGIGGAPQIPVAVQETRPAPPVILTKNLACPGCRARVTAKIAATELATQQVRCPGCKLIFLAADHLVVESVSQPKSTSPISTAPLPLPYDHMRVRSDPKEARMLGPLRLARAAVALLMVFVALSLVVTLLNMGAGKPTDVWPLQDAWQFAILLLVLFGVLWIVFDWMRGYVNEKHTSRYGYPHPSLKSPWSL